MAAAELANKRAAVRALERKAAVAALVLDREAELAALEERAARAANMIARAEAAIGSLTRAALLDTPGLDALEE